MQRAADGDCAGQLSRSPLGVICDVGCDLRRGYKLRATTVDLCEPAAEGIAGAGGFGQLSNGCVVTQTGDRSHNGAVLCVKGDGQRVTCAYGVNALNAVGRISGGLDADGDLGARGQTCQVSASAGGPITGANLVLHLGGDAGNKAVALPRCSLIGNDDAGGSGRTGGNADRHPFGGLVVAVALGADVDGLANIVGDAAVGGNRRAPLLRDIDLVGGAVKGDGTKEPLSFKKVETDNAVSSYTVMESSSEENENYPVRWHHMTSNSYKELHIDLLTDRVQDIFFTNQSDTDIVISSAGEPVRLSPGQMERVVNMNYYKPVPSRRKAKYEIWIESDHLHGAAHFDGQNIELKIDQEGNSVDVLDVIFGKKYVARWRQFHQMIDFSGGMPEVDLTIHNHSGRDFFVHPGYEALPDGETWTFEIER